MTEEEATISIGKMFDLAIKIKYPILIPCQTAIIGKGIIGKGKLAVHRSKKGELTIKEIE